MYLRIQSNSIRIRMERKDLAELIERGRLVDVLRFGPGSHHTFTYAVVVKAASPGCPRAHYHAGLLVVTIDHSDAAAWSEGDRLGFDHQQAVAGGSVRVILEKDFDCRDRQAGGEAEDALAFPSPSRVGG